MSLCVPGTYVWARTNVRYWPAITVSPGAAHMRRTKSKNVYVYWFGDKRISSVLETNLLPFAKSFGKVYTPNSSCMGKKWSLGVFEAIKEYSSNLPNDVSYKRAVEIALNTYGADDHVINKGVPTSIKPNLDKRQHIKWLPYNSSKNIGTLKKNVENGTFTTDICLACYSKDVYTENPLFQGNICEDCYDKLQHTTNVLDETLNYKFCTICGNYGKLIKCANNSCKRVFCAQCLSHLQIVYEHNGKCVICLPQENQYFQLKLDFDIKVQMYLCNHIAVKCFFDVNTEINLLVTFQGKSTVFQTLFPQTESFPVTFLGSEKEDVLGFSTIHDLSAPYMHAHYINLKNNTITKSTLLEISRKVMDNQEIHFLLGGSSHSVIESSEFDQHFIVQLFLQFYRLHELLITYHHQTEIKWVFEITPSVHKEFIELVSRFMKTEPFLVKAPYCKEKYCLVWTNIDTYSSGSIS